VFSRLDYDSIAPRYEWRYAVDHYPQLEGLVTRFGAGRRVLEAGCGTGHWLAGLADADETTEVAGIDPSEGMLAHARTRLPDAELVQGRAEALPWDDASFDAVICVNAIHHFDDAPAFIDETRRVLRPGGGVLIVALDPHRGVDEWWIYDWFEGALARDRARYPATERIRRWLRAHGFGAVETAEAQHLDLSMPAHTAREGGYLERHVTSQLGLLTDEDYAAGLERIAAAERRARARGEELTLRARLRLWATTGYRP